MNNMLWKLDHIGERLWMMATLIAAHAASLENGGKGLAVVAEETRRTGTLIHAMVEGAIMEEREMDRAAMRDLAQRLNLLAINGAIEALRITGFTGRQAAIYADEIRELADGILCLFDEMFAARRKQTAPPWAADPSSAACSDRFLLMQAGGISLVEPAANVQEVCVASAREDGKIQLRGMALPRIDLYRLLGKERESRTHVILRTPWAAKSQAFAVTAEASLIFPSPIGKPAAVPEGMPLAGYVRECWENENGEPFYFIDWARLL